MYSRKEEFVQNVFEYIANICKEQLCTVQTLENDNKIIFVLGVHEKELKSILKSITQALPDYIFLSKLTNVFNEVTEFIAREYIFFQAQEDIKSPCFAEYLKSFIYEAVNCLNHAYKFND